MQLCFDLFLLKTTQHYDDNIDMLINLIHYTRGIHVFSISLS